MRGRRQGFRNPRCKNGGAKLTIEGGTFNGGLNTIKNDDYGTLTITGGDFKNVEQAAVLNWNVARISGGTFESNKYAVLNGYANDSMDKGALVISGGTFKAPTVINKMGGATNSAISRYPVASLLAKYRRRLTAPRRSPAEASPPHPLASTSMLGMRLRPVLTTDTATLPIGHRRKRRRTRSAVS